MTAIGLVPPGLPGNQLLGNQSIFDLENWLLAPPPSPLRGSCAPLKTDTKFSQASRVSSSQPKNTQAQRHYINSEGRRAQGSHSIQLLLLLPWRFLYDISHRLLRGKFSHRQKPFSSLLPFTGSLRLLDLEDNNTHHCFTVLKTKPDGSVW